MSIVYRLHCHHHISNRLKQNAASQSRQLWLPYNPSCTWRGIAVMLKQEERSRHSGSAPVNHPCRLCLMGRGIRRRKKQVRDVWSQPPRIIRE
jgi:hypothetical protein